MSSISKNSATIQEYNISFDRIKDSRLKHQQEYENKLQQQQFQISNSNINNQQFRQLFQRPATASSTTLNRNNSAQIKQRPQSKASRLHQILLTNQNYINNLINDFSSESNSSSMSTGRTPRTPRFHYNNEASISILVKKPFKHYNNSKSSSSLSSTSAVNRTSSTKANEQTNTTETKTDIDSKTNSNQNDPKSKIPNPSSTLIVRTANVINEFADQFSRSKLQNQSVSFKNIKRSRSFAYSGLKPLNYVVEQKGPQIKNCIGIIKEPKGQTNINLKEIYEYKLKLLEQKNQAQAMIYKNNNNIENNNAINDNHSNDLNSRRSSSVEIIKVTVENIKPRSAQLLQATN